MSIKVCSSGKCVGGESVFIYKLYSYRNWFDGDMLCIEKVCRCRKSVHYKKCDDEESVSIEKCVHRHTFSTDTLFQ